jgi:hypothetical protein
MQWLYSKSEREARPAHENTIANLTMKNQSIKHTDTFCSRGQGKEKKKKSIKQSSQRQAETK